MASSAKWMTWLPSICSLSRAEAEFGVGEVELFLGD
jgi:hypothetical protein